ncbi:MAG: protease modulator HflK family protein [bacterium]
MNSREKTALLSTALNLCLTCAKFILYYFTGSIAILAEAWHSFSDIGTSILAYIAIRSTANNEKNPSLLTIEHLTPLFIGILLFIVSLSLLYKVLSAPRALLQGTGVAGIFFLVFALSSYFIYKFETSVGTEEHSVVLISDGLHSKADMAAALLIGISLILYRFKINLDKQLAFLIALFIFSIAIESIIHFLDPRLRKDPRMMSDYYAYRVTTSLFSVQYIGKIIHSGLEFFRSIMSRSPRIYHMVRKYYWVIILLPLLLWYASTSIKIIEPREEGFLLMFDRAVMKHDPLQPGLHFKLPWPIAKVVKVNTKEIRQMHIGNISNPQSFALLWTSEHGSGDPFLSGDNNYFHPYMILHYRIKNTYNFACMHNDPEKTLDCITHRVLSLLFARTSFYDIATTLRSRLMHEIHAQVQGELDRLNVGIELLSVNIKDTHPPLFVADSFEKVIASVQEKQRIINTAYAYRNQQLPEAYGKAARKVAQAKASNEEKICHTDGDISRLQLKLESWGKYPNVSRITSYLSEMKKGMRSKDLIIIDPKAGEPQMWIGFPENLDYSALKKEGQKK